MSDSTECREAARSARLAYLAQSLAVEFRDVNEREKLVRRYEFDAGELDVFLGCLEAIAENESDMDFMPNVSDAGATTAEEAIEAFRSVMAMIGEARIRDEVDFLLGGIIGRVDVILAKLDAADMALGDDGL